MKPFGRRSLVKSVFSSFKQQVKIFFRSIVAKKPVVNWNSFCKLFILYYNHLMVKLTGLCDG